jgi:recombinational DNA repair protein (RecF pathway)
MVERSGARPPRFPTVPAVSLRSDEALCIRCWDWSETSQTVWLFGRELGLVRCLAKGSKRADNRFSGGIETLTRVEIQVSLRAPERTPGALATLACADLVEVFPAVRASLGAFHAGLAIADALAHGTHDADPHPRSYDAALHALRCIGVAPPAPQRDHAWHLARFLWTLLDETGHAPSTTHDARSRQPLDRTASVYCLMPSQGGFTSAGEAQSPAWRVRPATLAALRVIADQASHGAPPGADVLASAERACRLLVAYFREVFACDPKALRAWEAGLVSRE